MPTPAAYGETSLDGSVAARSGPSPSSTESYLRGDTVNDKVPGEDPSATTPPPDIFFYGLRSRVDEFPNGHTDPDGRRRRGLVALRSGLRGRHPPSDDPGQRASQRMRRPRRLVYYSQTNPVVVTDIEDVVDSCPSGSTCMRVTSSITVTLEADDDPDEVEEAIRSERGKNG